MKNMARIAGLREGADGSETRAKVMAHRVAIVFGHYLAHTSRASVVSRPQTLATSPTRARQSGGALRRPGAKLQCLGTQPRGRELAGGGKAGNRGGRAAHPASLDEQETTLQRRQLDDLRGQRSRPRLELAFGGAGRSRSPPARAQADGPASPAQRPRWRRRGRGRPSREWRAPRGPAGPRPGEGAAAAAAAPAPAAERSPTARAARRPQRPQVIAPPRQPNTASLSAILETEG
ncbi:unnamed protein product [Prorocentrum cordatum]|uniref:Uncharacterized protein n=1 Tax=Prorocentrum cordatum TaxID=2364126 RepID=A0ABN9TBZ4_9DINO|nr:unnamed protein product [Polarella glacialis]